MKKLIAGWSLTNMCNLRCKHCYNSSGCKKKDELTFEEAKKVADKLKKNNVIAVNFGGGECGLRKDFIKLCQYLNKLEIKISYTTNGTTFDLIKDHLHLFHDVGVSIDFAEEKKHDSFRGVKGTYKKAIKTIKELVKNNVDTEIVTCITKLNCNKKELEKIYDLAKKLNVDCWRLNRYRSNGRGILNDDLLKLSKEDLRNAFSFLNSIRQDKYKISTPEPLFRAAYGGFCSIIGDPSGKTAFRIQVNGEVSPSVFLKESGGNIKDKSIKEIFNSKIFRAIRNRKAVGKCKYCKNYYHCHGGDAGASYLAYGHFNGPDPLCWLNPKHKSNVILKEAKNWNVHELYLCTLYLPIKK